MSSKYQAESGFFLTIYCKLIWNYRKLLFLPYVSNSQLLF